MKQFLFIAIAALTVLSSCQKDPSVSVTPQTATISTKGGTVNFTVSADGEWQTSTAADIIVSPSSGSGNSPVSITVPENISGTDRVVEVLFCCVKGSSRQTVSITQVFSEDPISVKLSEVPDTVDFAAGDYTVKLETNYGWEATALTEGITFNPDHGNAGTSSIIVSVPAYTGTATEYRNLDFTISINSITEHRIETLEIKQMAPNILYGGDKYKLAKLKDGNIWMAEPLRFVPEGSSVSDNPATGSICYPQGFTDVKAWKDTTYTDTAKTTIKTIAWKHSETFAPLKDEASIASHGLLYSWDIIFGEAVTKDNYDTFEGCQGICPEGWYIPSKSEWKALVGYVNGEETDKNAPYYTTEYDGGNIASLESQGFMFGFTGMIANKKYSATNVITSAMSDVPEYIGSPAMTYIASSTGKAPAAGKDATQMYAPMSTFSAGTYDKNTSTIPDLGKYPDGRLTVGFANFAGGFVQVRCVMDKTKNE